MGKKSSKKSRREKPPKYSLPSEQELFGSSRRYRFLGSSGRHVAGYKLLGVYRNREPGYVTPYMERIGNIQSAWHGTKAKTLQSIAVDGLLRPTTLYKRGQRGKPGSGMFGPGIYTSPEFRKAFGHSMGHGGLRYILKCLVALGRSFYPDSVGDKRSYLEAAVPPYDSVVARAGVPLDGAWRTALNLEEWVVYNNQQVTVDEIYIYAPEGSPGNIEDNRPSLLFPTRGSRARRLIELSSHPCKREGKICVYAYGHSGCIELNRKSGCSKQDAMHCRDYRSSRT